MGQMSPQVHVLMPTVGLFTVGTGWHSWGQEMSGSARSSGQQTASRSPLG